MIDSNIYEDPRYLDIGDLPSGFLPYRNSGLTQIYIRPFVVRELSLLHMGAKASRNKLSHIIRAVNMTISCDVSQLTDGDFEFILAWLRLRSFPESPLLVTWNCRKNNVVYKEDRRFYQGAIETLTEREMKLQNLEWEQCDTENKTIVHQSSTQLTAFDDDLETLSDPELDYSRINTLQDYHNFIEEQPHMLEIGRAARWIKHGTSFTDKLEYLMSSPDLSLLERIEKARKTYKHGIFEHMKMRCRVCVADVEHSADPDYTTFFADNTEQNILDIQYTLLGALKMQPDDDMPSKTLLYHYSCYVKDKKEEEERRRVQKNSR